MARSLTSALLPVTLFRLKRRVSSEPGPIGYRLLYLSHGFRDDRFLSSSPLPSSPAHRVQFYLRARGQL